MIDNLNLRKTTREEFEIIKNTTKAISNARRFALFGNSSTAMPEIMGLKLTNRCNLRCTHCYEWNEDGYHHNMEQEDKDCDLSYSIIEKCLDETKDIQSSIYLWGGEPLVYKDIKNLLKRLSCEDRVVAICTNGLKIEENLDSLILMGHKLELLIALEGLEKENDTIRGQGVYKKVIKAINKLAELKRNNVFTGKISVHTMISNENIDTLDEYIDTMSEQGIENLILCLPWYISEKDSFAIDDFYAKNFTWLENKNYSELKSWHAFKYRLLESNIPKLIEFLPRLKKYQKKFNVKLQPDILEKSIAAFVKGESIHEDNSKICLSLFSRMDVLPNGDVSSCKHFPEFTVGNLMYSNVKELWNCKSLKKVRGIMKKDKMSACYKCNNFYLHNVK